MPLLRPAVPDHPPADAAHSSMPKQAIPLHRVAAVDLGPASEAWTHEQPRGLAWGIS